MSFDVFGDFAERGYPPNYAGTKDLEKIKIIEHRSFRSLVERALNRLGDYKVISAALGPLVLHRKIGAGALRHDSGRLEITLLTFCNESA